MANDVKFQIGAEDTGVAATMAQVEETIVAGVEQIKASIGGISDAFAKVNAAFLAITAIMAGGEAFKEVISSTVNMTVDAQKLGRQLGISATDASVLNVALASVFVTQDQYSAAANKVTQTLKKNEAAFQDLGVATRDSGGHLVSTQEIIQSTTDRLLEFKEGTDRNVEGVKIFGRQWGEIAPILRLTSQAIEDARIKSDALGLTIGQENVEATKNYRTAMNDVHEVIKAVEKVIGEAILPVLTSLGHWFGEVGPQIVQAFRAAMAALTVVCQALWGALKAVWDVIVALVSPFTDAIGKMFGGESLSGMQLFVNALKVIEIACIGVRVAFQLAAEFIIGTIEHLNVVIQQWAALTKAALSLDWEGVKAAWKKGGDTIEADSEARFQKLVDIANKAGEDIQNAVLGDPTKKAPITPTKISTDGETSDGGDAKQKNQMLALEERLAAFKANFAEQLALQGNFQEFSKSMDRDYWQAVLNTTKLSVADQLSIKKKIAADTEAIAKAGYEGELADLKAQESQYKGNLEAKLQLAVQYAAKIAAAEGGDSAKAKQAEGQVLAIQRELAAQQIAIAKATRAELDKVDLAAIDTAQKIDQAEVAEGMKTNAQLLADERSFEQQRYQIKLEGLQRDFAAEAANPDRSPAKLAAINAQILSMQTQHEQQMTAISLKSAKEQDKYWTDLFSSMNSGFTSTISGFLKGTASIGATIKGLFQDIGNAIADTLAKMLSNWITTQIQQAIMGKVSALANITAAAALAGANAYASTAAIPVVGPELAPAAAATAYTGAMSFAAAASASGGYDIPAGVNPIVQAHAQEMVLPSNISDGFRNIIAGLSAGGGSGASKPSGPIQIMLHPDFMNTTMRDFLAGELARSLATGR
jgi:hypothetical protein